MHKKKGLLIFSLSVSILTMAQSVPSDKKNVNNKPYLYTYQINRHAYTADAAPQVMPDGKVWMVTSVAGAVN